MARIASYDELCVRVEIESLVNATEDAIAYVAPETMSPGSAPIDYAGILGPEPLPEGLALTARHPEGWWTAPISSPALYAASLGGVLCLGGLHHGEHRSGHTLLAQDRFIVPDSYFVRNRRRSLPADMITSIGTNEPQTLALSRERTAVVTQPGLYYFAGAAWEQFGHFVLEGLSRMWLLALLPEPLRAELRLVLYNDRPLKTWQLEILEGLGVGADRLLYLDEPMRFERLIIPSIAYDLHRAGAYAQRDTWEHIGRAFDRGHGPGRVYISRSRYTAHRALINEVEAELRFRAHGFTVLHPQELSIAEQVAAIRHARLIAGNAGSGMHLSAFARRGARKLIISPRYFTLRDDQLISNLRGEQIAYILCSQDAAVENPRMADYQVDLDVLDQALDQWIGG
jgi:capsular polysaccharide biosynthesis protein